MYMQLSSTDAYRAKDKKIHNNGDDGQESSSPKIYRSLMSTVGSPMLNPLSPLSILFVQLSWDTNVFLLGLPNKTNEQTVTTITKAWLPIHYFASHKVPQDCVVSESALGDLSIVIIYTHLTIHCWASCQIGSSNCIWHTPSKKPFIADIAACTHRIIYTIARLWI